MLPFLGSALGSSATLDQFDAKQLISLDHTRYRPLNRELPTLRFFDIISPVRINEIIPQNQIFTLVGNFLCILYLSSNLIYKSNMHILNLYTVIKHIYSYLLISQIFPPNPKSSLPPKIFGFGFLPPSIKFIQKTGWPLWNEGSFTWLWGFIPSFQGPARKLKNI